jgi:flagellar M-ring protein FliF
VSERFNYTSLKNGLQKIWSQSSPSARITLGVSSMLAISLIGGVIYWSMQPQFVPLVSKLEPGQAAEIVSALEAEGIANKRNFSGSGILVDQAQWSEAKAIASGIVPPDQLESGAGATPWSISDPGDRENRNIRDLERRLEKTITRQVAIESATVHLGVPEPSPFLPEQTEKTASVTIHLKPGQRFSARNARAVASIVANGVEGLKLENITLVDTEGNDFSQNDSVGGAVGSQIETRRDIENDLAGKAESMLEQLLGPGRATVRVTADIDFNQLVTLIETPDPESKVAIKEEIDKSKSTQADPLAGNYDPRAGGPAGTSANGPVPKQKSAGSGGGTSTEKMVMEYQAGLTKETRTVHPGAIRRLTVAAMVQLEDPPPAVDPADSSAPAKGGDDPAKTAAKPRITPEQAESLIKKAVGFDESREDAIEVVIVDRIATAIPLESADPEDPMTAILPIVRNASLGIAALVALVIAILTLKKLRPIEVPAAGRDVSPERVRQLNELAALARNNPELVTGIMASWIGATNAQAKNDSLSGQRKAA